jgi:hypothetical protein
MTSEVLRLVPLADMNLRGRYTAAGLVGFVDGKGQAVSLAVMAPFCSVSPSFTGDPNVASTLTAADGTWTGEDVVLTYQWYRDGAAIGGATASTRVLASADMGHTVTLKVTGTNSAGADTVLASSSAAVLDTVPVNSVVPAISGTGTVGDLLTCSTGTFSGVANTYTYQWNKDAVAIGGATASTYTPVAGDATHNITCTVTATNTGGAASATSVNKAITA